MPIWAAFMLTYQYCCCYSLIFLLVLLLSSSNGKSNAQDSCLGEHQSGNLSLGAVVDLTSLAGKEDGVAIQVAVKDFYARARIQQYPNLHVENSRGDPIRAASSAKALIENYNARAIIGLETWQEAVFVAQLGNESQVPIVSLANDQEVPLWASYQWPFLINAARGQYAQMKAVAAIIQSWQWRKVNIIYEDFNPTAGGISPKLIAAIQAVDVEISDLMPLSPFTPNPFISENLKCMQIHGECRVFIVHTSVSLGIKIFKEAKNLGMMGKDFVWITTNAITSQLDTLDASSIFTMQGVLGVQAYFSSSRKLFKEFRSSFRASFHSQYPDEPLPEPTSSTLQAYDATWAVLRALEGKPSWKSYKINSTGQFACIDEINGQHLLKSILQSKFEGLTGAFNFSEGNLAPVHIFKIVNVVGKSYRELGYWSEELGFSESIHRAGNNNSMTSLGQVFWPGGPWSVPRGWAVATNASRLKIGVPAEPAFREFVNITYNHPGGDPTFSGFSIDVFKATIKLLPYDFPYDFILFPGTYDSLVQQVYVKTFDAVVGDISIVANRCAYAEFTQPYTDPGLQMLIYIKPDKSEKAWLFTKPFTSLMWIFTVLINIYNGFVVWFIERDHDQYFRGNVPNQIGTMLTLSCTTLFSLQGERLHSNLSRMALVVWLFVALVVTQSFTASLTSLLTVQRLEEKTIDIETLKKNGAKVGCDGNSYVVKYLEMALGFKPNNIKRIYIADDYPRALMSGDIAVAFVDVPYVKVFLAKHCAGFTTSGPTFKVGGFGFAFPRGSPYLPDISQAVLNLSEAGKLEELERSLTSSCSAASTDNYNNDRLGVGSFWGLFVITGGTSTIALLVFIFRSGSGWCQQAVAPSEAQPHSQDVDHSSDDHEILESQASHEMESQASQEMESPASREMERQPQ